jgi:hypothetical protein
MGGPLFIASGKEARKGASLFFLALLSVNLAV